MARAVLICRALVAHGLGAFNLLGRDPVVELAQRILEWIARGRRTRFRTRDTQHDQVGGLWTRDAVEPCLRLLVDFGYLFPLAPAPREPQGGPSATPPQPE